jgi:outer membrane protein TolC
MLDANRRPGPSPRALLLAGWLVGAAARAAAQPPVESSLDLERAVDLARTRNERATSAAARADAAAALVTRARAFFFPELAVVGTYTRRAYETVRNVGGESVTIQSRDALQGTAVASLALFDARSIPLYRIARRERTAARYEAEEERRLVSFEAADAFLRSLGTEQVLAAAERRLEFARRNLHDAEARFEAELVGSNDVTRARLELATAAREQARARASAQTAVLALGHLLDARIEGPLVLPAALLDSAAALAPRAAALVEVARERRLDVRSGRQRAAAAHLFAQEPLARWLPSLGFAGTSRITNEGGLSGRDSDWSLALNLSWSLYDGGERLAERSERRSLAQIADLDSRALGREVELEVETARVTLQSAQAAIQAADVAVEVARRNADESAELYRQGLARALEVADASVRLFEAEVALASERFGLGLAYLDLRAALGLDPLGREPQP